MDEKTTSYSQIAKSTGIFGGSQLLIIVLGIVRTKVLAVLLGTAGVGLAGMLQSVVDLMRSLTGLGLSFSSVKDIAQANTSRDEVQIAQTVTMLHRWLWFTGILGTILTIVFAPLLSDYIFGNDRYVWSICLLSICVLAGTLSTGQMALLQGLRRITWMAKASFFSAVVGLLATLPLYWFFGIKGIVPALLVVAGIGLFFSWMYARKIKVVPTSQTWAETWNRGGGMVKLGLFTVASGLVSSLTMFLLRSFILKQAGVDPVGLFQAVWSITTIYMGSILTSMAADYYPRLCSQSSDNNELRRFSNEQTRFVLLLSTPLIVLLLILANPVLDLLYSSRFNGATELLRWQLLGTFLKVAVWPIGFILLAKGKGLRFLIVEVAWYALYYGFTLLLWPTFGLNATGIGFAVAYIVYFPLVYSLIKPLCNFAFDRRNLFLLVAFLLLTLAAFLLAQNTNGLWLYASGSLILILSSLWSLYELNRILPLSVWKSKIKKRLNRP